MSIFSSKLSRKIGNSPLLAKRLGVVLAVLIAALMVLTATLTTNAGDGSVAAAAFHSGGRIVNQTRTGNESVRVRASVLFPALSGLPAIFQVFLG